MTLRSRSFHLPGTAKAAMEVVLGEFRENHSRTQHVTSSLLFYCRWLDFFRLCVVCWAPDCVGGHFFSLFSPSTCLRCDSSKVEMEMDERKWRHFLQQQIKTENFSDLNYPRTECVDIPTFFPGRINQCMFNCAKNKYIKPRLGHRVCVCCFWGFNISTFCSH